MMWFKINLVVFSFLTMMTVVSMIPVAERNELISEGKCLGIICLYKTTPKEIMAIYGKGEILKYKKRHEEKRGYSTVKWITLEYKELGLKFRAGSSKTGISDIEVSLPFNAKTEKGAELGVSSVSDIIKIYGHPQERKSNGYSAEYNPSIFICCDSVYCYPSQGVDFTFYCDTSFVTEKGKTQLEKKNMPKCFIVKKIHVYSPINH